MSVNTYSSVNGSATEHFVSARNSCKLCAPLGAALAMRGIGGCVPLIHGSQGCSTYIRRYCISHFREPVDIASSNFVEATAIFGGRDNLFKAIGNVSKQYEPKVIGIASTCLSETIGENVEMYLREFKDNAPVLFYASTPSYRGSHADGFSEAVYAAVKKITGGAEKSAAITVGKRFNVISNFVSCADLRELHRLLKTFDTNYTLLPDYSETLDGAAWEEYQKIPQGGTKLEEVAMMQFAEKTISLNSCRTKNAASYLQDEFNVPAKFIPLPIGISNTDIFLDAVADCTGHDIVNELKTERGRLIDAYIDGHKYVSGKRVILYGELDFAAAMTSFLQEIGMNVLCSAPSADFASMLEQYRDAGADMIIGSSKGLFLSRELGIPLMRCGFPIHDRIGGHRILHIGYRGTLNLFEQICNTLIEHRQNDEEHGWTYI